MKKIGLAIAISFILAVSLRADYASADSCVCTCDITITDAAAASGKNVDMSVICPGVSGTYSASGSCTGAKVPVSAADSNACTSASDSSILSVLGMPTDATAQGGFASISKTCSWLTPAEAEKAVNTKEKNAYSGAGGTTANPSGSSVNTLLGQAQSLNQTGLGGSGAVSAAVKRVISFLIYPIGAFALALFVWAGFLWMTAAGNAERVSKAERIMVWTALGVLMSLGSYVVVSYIFSVIK